jgi:hypothetical protein
MTGTVPECPIWYNGCKPTVLSQIHQESDEFRFEINPCNPCVANKIVNGMQMTICFHVDDCKLSHHSSRANDNMIGWLRQEYKSIFEDRSGKMTVSRGRVHKYVGMTLDYTVRR